MTTFLLGTTSAHTAAAACDYLESRIDETDTLVVLGVEEPDTPDRDIGDAVNVVRARLAVATVETARREVDGQETSERTSGGAASRAGDPAEEIQAVAEERDVDEILVGRRRGDPMARGQPGLGSTATAVAGEADRPVVILPIE